MAGFAYRDKGSPVALGGYDGWGTLGKYVTFSGGRFQGFIARLGHGLLYHQQQLEIYGVWRGLATWLIAALNPLVRPPLKLE